MIFSFSCLSASLTNSPAAPCTFIALPSDPAGLALCIGMEDGCVKYYDVSVVFLYWLCLNFMYVDVLVSLVSEGVGNVAHMYSFNLCF